MSSGRRPIDLGDERRLVAGKKILDARQRRHERLGKVRKRRRADDHQQADVVPHHRVAFVRLVADAAVVGQRDPAALADRRQPVLVSRIVGKVIGVPLDCQATCPENLAEPLPEVAVGEIDAGQAARS